MAIKKPEPKKINFKEPESTLDLPFEKRRELFLREVNGLIQKYGINLAISQNIITTDNSSSMAN